MEGLKQQSPPPPYTDEVPNSGEEINPERGSTSALVAVESFIMDCSDGDEEPLINDGNNRQSSQCRWQKAVKVKDYGMWNMCSCLCCCWIIAIAGLYKSLKCQSAKKRGDFKTAMKYSRQARILFWVSFIAGLVVIGIIAAIYGYMIVSMVTMMSRQTPPEINASFRHFNLGNSNIQAKFGQQVPGL